MNVFVPFLDKYYKDKYEFNSRSIKIALNYVEMDLVVTSAPSESQEDILESDSVKSLITPDQDSGSDWVLLKTWIEPRRRSIYKSFSFLEERKRLTGWQSETLRNPDREQKKW